MQVRIVKGQMRHQQAKALAHARRHITVATGSIPRAYEVIDAVFAIDSHTEGFLSGADPSKAFEGVKQQLIERCRRMGGDAVIDCQFEYRVAVADGLFYKKQCMEIFAYGTVVKILEDDDDEEEEPAAQPAQTSATVGYPSCGKPIPVDALVVGQNVCPHCRGGFAAE